MHATDAAHPAGGTAHLGDGHDRFGEVAGVGGVTAEVGRLQHSHDADLTNQRHTVVGQLADTFGFVGVQCQLRGDLFHATKNCVRHDEPSIGRVEPDLYPGDHRKPT